ncbi:MAG: hypothetical protein ABGY41_23405 [Candidatus Poribacteria bacterium]
MTKPTAGPATLAETRARDLSPWRRAFRRGAGRVALLVGVATSAVAGAAVAWMLLHMPYGGSLRNLVPATRTPNMIVEVRDAARLASIEWVATGFLEPLWQEITTDPAYATLVASLAPEPDSDPWQAVSFALGREAVLATYPGAGGGSAFLLIGAPAPMARVELARAALTERWPRVDGMTSVSLEGVEAPIHYATRGLLVIAASDPALVSETLAVLDGADGFLTREAQGGGSRLAARVADQSTGRSGSFYAQTPGGPVLGEFSLYAGDWSANVWAPSAAVTPDPDVVRAARVLARRAAGSSAMVFWHAGITAASARTILADSMALTWAPQRQPTEGYLPLVITMPGGEGAGGLLPELAVTVATSSARAVRNALARGDVRVSFQGSAAKVRVSGDETTVGLPLGFGLRYPIHVAAARDSLTFATSSRALTGFDGDGPSPVAESTQRRADLFQLVADAPALHTAVSRAVGLAALAGGGRAAALGSVRRLMPLLARSDQLTATGLATPDGFRIDIHASILPPGGHTEALGP